MRGGRKGVRSLGAPQEPDRESREEPQERKRPSKTMSNKQRYCGQLQNPCLNREFPRGDQRNYHSLKIFVFLHGLMIWRVMQRNGWSDIVS